MKTLAALILMMFFFSCESSLESNQVEESLNLEISSSKQSDEKVLINHKDKEISVSASAVEAHLAHGDSVVDDDDEPQDPGPR